MGSSLSAGLSRAAAAVTDGGLTFARLFAHNDLRRAKRWAVPRAQHLSVLFTGHLDNAAPIAALLGRPCPAAGDPDELAILYGHALLAWGADTDLRLIGEYAVAIADPSLRTLRLARSPLRAPPLHFYQAGGRMIASTAVRAIFACGIEKRTNPAKLADMAWFNASDEGRGWYLGVERVALGSTVTLGPGRRETQRFYDLGALKPLPRMTRADYLATARDLLAEGTRAALAGSSRPAIMLSGGLDSSLVAINVLDALPGDQPVDTYTFTVRHDWDGHTPPGTYGDERPRVAALCQRYPRLTPHFHSNDDRAFTDDLTKLFHTIGGAPQGLANMGVYHSLWQAARGDGCDRVLLGEFGNMTVSDDGNWAYSHYFKTLRWIQLFRALRSAPDDQRSLLRRFAALAVMPFLPDSLWHWQRGIRGIENLYPLASPLRQDYARKSGAVDRAKAANLPNPRYPLRDRLAMIREVHDNTWGEFSDVYSGFEQIYGMEQRDPTAYRPFFEFCAGLPANMVLYDGQDRRLARDLLNGRMDDEFRLSRLNGSHNADWYTRMTPRVADLREEIDRAANDPDLAEMLDFDRLRMALDSWPETSDMSSRERLVCSAAIPRAILYSRFFAYTEGRNDL
ncbi:asparagine synthase-related protein [Novosphingobium sp.]|uniref:asparagine synthase-related protein n=1 Tax=Novosphingobium sp. TaxID=1874826 RepID=UPI0025DEF282|nr:asparagine synthase-related protein [Novosphingobium sp.]